MAEAILRDRADGRYEVASAGMEPKGVHPLTLSVLLEIGVSTDGLRSKPASEFLGKAAVRYAIIVCERANQQCPRIYPFTGQTLYWPFNDPAASGHSEAEGLEEFRRVRDQISARIDAWLNELGRIP